ncbi:hypothetical protein ACOT81_33055 [Streptomyces sp. WI04-05B]|uniref:hypothetical protein n=1 Tax=Streptomyces TaxID=1883 RepID=UPI0029BCFCFF|nr:MULTISPECIES: hypothetical protein [unclassified Streptomyces]MDX2547042.1 hypothetical protein [Streptomyces sp. WI04-05B]MDX2589731.1 hypothetical protein [Streptomyces sp. WI04-05A]
MRNLARGALTVFSTAALTAAMALGAAGPAGASATGTTTIGSFSYDLRGAGIKVPVGCFLTHTIKGSGKRITSQFAGVDCVGVAATFSRFCNWRIDFTYADTENKTYRTSRGATHTECERDPLRHNAPQKLPKYGKACARFHVNGKLRATQCHFVTK